MNSNAEEQDLLRGYLLGSLQEADRAPLEERLLKDDDFYEQLLIAEDELAEQYLAGGLAGAEREHFESHFLSTPERRRKVRFARAMRRYAAASSDAAPAPARVRKTPFSVPFFGALSWRGAFVLAAASLLLVFGVSWLALKGRGPSREGPRRPLAVALSPSGVREGGVLTRLTVAPGTDEVQLRLPLPADEYQTYRAELRTAEGPTVTTVDDLSAETLDGARVVVFRIDPSMLPPGDYELRLGGGGAHEPVARYPFRVLPR
jgi:hypothetical protein